jgi:hypothetical protein
MRDLYGEDPWSKQKRKMRKLYKFALSYTLRVDTIFSHSPDLHLEEALRTPDISDDAREKAIARRNGFIKLWTPLRTLQAFSYDE